MQHTQEVRPDSREDFFVQATIKVNGYAINDLPCKIYLPENPLAKPRLEFKPNYAQWQQVTGLWRPAFEAKVFDHFGRTSADISAPVVYLENMRSTAWGQNLYDCAFTGDPHGLRVVRYLSDSTESRSSSPTRFSLWVSPNAMLQPFIMETASFTGDVEMKRVHQVQFQLTPDILLAFDTEFRYKTLPAGERLRWSNLVANLDCALAAHEVDAFASSIIPIVDDFLWVAGLGSRTRTACLGWAASDGQTYTTYYRGDLVFPTGIKEASFVDGLVSRGDYGEFLSKSWSAFNVHPGKEAIKGAIQTLIPNRHQTLEESFLSLFAGLEELILDYRVRNGLELIIPAKSAWNKIRKSIMNVIRNSNEPKLEKNQRMLLYNKLEELNRVPLKHAFERFASVFGIDSSDLWPVFSNTEGVGLSNIRNKLIHGDRFPETLINELAIARDQLKWTLERAVLSVLGWCVARSEVSAEFLSAGATSYTQMPGARKRISEYLSPTNAVK